ncbi:MAG: primosomal protein N' [Oscillospiraceae bacterium]|nr:primosomal protein N' [Oscillospiraceae bacterium]
MIAKVAIAKTTRGYDREYFYAVPERLSGRAAAGCGAIVPFGAKNAERSAIILSVHAQEGESFPPKPYTALKLIVSILGDAPMLLDKDIELASRMREKYRCTWFDAFSCMLPPGWARRAGGAKKIKGVKAALPADEIRAAIGALRVNRAQQIRVLERMLANIHWASGGVPARELAADAGVTPSVVDTLIKKGYLARIDLEAGADGAGADSVGAGADTGAAMGAGTGAGASVETSIGANAEISTGADAGFTLTGEQNRALSALTNRSDERKFSETLIYGVTGSGKTEIYIRLVSHIISMGRKAIVLVPEISLTPQMMRMFTGHFGSGIAIFHSRLSELERRAQWALVRSGAAGVALGARSAVFAPFDKLGAIIIDEEHESSYKSEMSPRYHTADIAKMRCESHGALLVYGSATPSVELFYRARRGLCDLLTLKERANRRPLPDVHIADMRDELKSGNRGMFSRRLSNELYNALADEKQAILFLNRRGYSSFLLCHACGYIVSCRDCSVSFTYHRENNRLVCHYCGMTVPMPRQCPLCRSADISGFGAGTEKVEQEVRRLFPECRVLRMDRDTAVGKDAYSRILNAFRDGAADVLIGTQMIAKGHDFPNVTIVGVLAADSILNFADFRATERTFQLLTQVSGRSGRGEAAGRVVIQTYNPDHFSVAAAKEHDYMGFYRQEMTARQALRYPPFMQIGVFVLSGLDDARVYASANALFQALKDESVVGGANGFTILSPARPPHAKIKEMYRWRIILKHRDAGALEFIARRVAESFYSGKKNKGVDLVFDINPFSML